MTQQTIIRALCCFSIGILLLAYHHTILIIRWPWHQYTQPITQHHATKKQIVLHYCHHYAWHTEKNVLIMSDDRAQAFTYLINTWLTLLNEEKIMNKKIELQTAVLSPTKHELFISFDRTPFTSEQTIHEKWMWIEGLLKTIKGYDTTIGYVHLLVRHKSLHDKHLDFSNAWPINGFTH